MTEVKERLINDLKWFVYLCIININFDNSALCLEIDIYFVFGYIFANIIIF